jgi:hypothetical protein
VGAAGRTADVTGAGVNDVVVAMAAAVYLMMPPGGGARAKKANSGVAEKAFETNSRSAPFLCYLERELRFRSRD